MEADRARKFLGWKPRFDEPAAALSAIERDYEKNNRAAQALAEEYLDSKRIVANVLEQTLS